jgi:hypothetical protein
MCDFIAMPFGTKVILEVNDPERSVLAHNEISYHLLSLHESLQSVVIATIDL